MDGAAAQQPAAQQPADPHAGAPQVGAGQVGAEHADATAEAGPDSGLSRRELDILDFERKWWKYAGAKEDAIRELFGLSPTRYYQVLNAVVDRDEALAVDPMLVKRLRRLRASRQKARAARKLGFRV